MSVQNSHPLVGWQISSLQPAASAPAALWYGNPENNNYDVGVGHSGVARIPTMKLPAGVGLTLSFDVYLDVQASIAYDLFEVRLIAQGWSQNVLLWSKKKSTGSKQWQSVSVDLTGYAGQSVQIHFIFDSVNETSNDGLGVFCWTTFDWKALVKQSPVPWIRIAMMVCHRRPIDAWGACVRVFQTQTTARRLPTVMTGFLVRPIIA